MTRLRIATRGSDLALVQTRQIAAELERALGVRTELVVVRTTGDRILDRSLAKIGGKGLFVKEIEEALLAGDADLAVHSAKDVPARLAPGCAIACYPERRDARDALAARERGTTLASLRPGARVGTGSTRRMALLRALRPDLELVPLRGNVPTRLGRLDGRDGLDAVVLACAGLDRLGLADRIDERIAPEAMLPAIGQGLLALETRTESEWHARLAALEPPATGPVARAERAYQTTLGGDCSIPLAGFAEHVEGGRLRLRGLVASLDGRTLARAEAVGPVDSAETLGARVAQTVLEGGGRAILDAIAAETAAEGGADGGAERGADEQGPGA